MLIDAIVPTRKPKRPKPKRPRPHYRRARSCWRWLARLAWAQDDGVPKPARTDAVATHDLVDRQLEEADA